VSEECDLMNYGCLLDVWLMIRFIMSCMLCLCIVLVSVLNCLSVLNIGLMFW